MQIKRESPERTAVATGTPGKSGRPPNTAYLALMKPDEDWREIEDATERRKIQNRLAQRAYRRSLRSRNKELESLKKQLGTFQESHSRPHSRASRSRSSSGVSVKNTTCPSPDASPSPPPMTDLAAMPTAGSTQPPPASMPASLSPAWPQDCGPAGTGALDHHAPYGMHDFMYFDAYAPTHDVVPGLAAPPPTTTAGFDLAGFEGLETGAGAYAGLATTANPVSMPPDASSAWLSPPASEEPDMQHQHPHPHQQLLAPFDYPVPLGNHAPATPPEHDYTTATTTAFPPFTAPDGLGLVYPHHHQHHHHNHSAAAALDPALFDADMQQQQPSPPTPPSSSCPSDPHASLLHMAVASGNLEVLRLLLARAPALASRPDGDGCTPAQRAARAGRDDMLAVLGAAEERAFGLAAQPQQGLEQPMC